ncbi:MAG: formylglycine-generating enzyme family protein [Patescibacteria group bacterium]
MHFFFSDLIIAFRYRNYRKENYGKLIVSSNCDDEVEITNSINSKEKEMILINGDVKREIKENSKEEFNLLAGKYMVKLSGDAEDIRDVKVEGNKSVTLEFKKEKPKVPKNFVLVEGDGEEIKKLYVCKYPVTQKEYESVMGYNPSEFAGNPNNPVECVTWYNAVMYCNKLSKKKKLKPMYEIIGISKDGKNITGATVKIVKGNGYKLLTDDEWVWVAKGGKKSKGYNYSGSNNIDEVAWYRNNSKSKTHPVGQKKPNELGLYDMSGNVWEWNEKESGSARCVRGGCWYGSCKGCKIAYQYNDDANFSNTTLGFRVCRSWPLANISDKI